MKRRDFLCASSLALLLSGCDRDDSAESPKAPAAASPPPQNGEPTVALSLAVLQKSSGGIRRRSGAAAIPEINQITGFLVDGSDAVIFGHKNSALPEIELDSLVVAMRNAYGGGGDPAYQGIPGCSIDPVPGEDPFRIEKVSVFGIPACLMSSRFVFLDYELKRAGANIRAADGEKIFPSAFELAERNGSCAQGEDRAISMTHRYWYFPKVAAQPRFQRDDSARTVSILQPVGVQLLTEREFLDRRGERTGATEADPAAREFAEAVTAVLEGNRVARFAQMVHDFRVIELAKLMRFCGVPADALAFLLQGYELAKAEVPTLVGGIRQEQEGRTVCKATVTQTDAGVEYKETASHYRYEYRGGVEARVELADADIASTGLDGLRRRVLGARPSPDALSWEIA